MKTSGSLLNDKNQSGIVSPLVDVLFNLMITMFVFLIIYMAVVTPKKEQLLHFLKEFQMPAGSIFSKYESNIPVAGGSGNFTFLFGTDRTRELEFDEKRGEIVFCPLRPKESKKTDTPLKDTYYSKGDNNIELNTTSGVLLASFFAGNKEPGQGRSTYFDVLVIDNARTIPVNPERAENWGKINLHFYQEHQTDIKGSDETIPCYIAIRKKFMIRVNPQTIPFDPHRHTLHMSAPEVITATKDIPIKEALSPIGGIEPYEFKLRQAPDWLHIDPEKGVITGKPGEAHIYDLRVELKDAQTHSWHSARQSQNEPGHPYKIALIKLVVEDVRPITARLLIPDHVRLGSFVKGAVVAEGGYGRLKYSEETLPQGLKINPKTGELSGIPEKVGRYTISVKVIDEYPNIPNQAVFKKELVVIKSKPEPAILSKGDLR